MRQATINVFALFLVLVTTSPAFAEKRVALVIGNSAYEHTAPLPNPKNDAKALTAVLKRLGFEVLGGTDLSHRKFVRSVVAFSRKLRSADVGLFFYAGHGLQVSGQNYLVPIDAELKDEADLQFAMVKLNDVLAQMERSTKTNLIFIDACRDNPLARSLARAMGRTRSGSIGRGLASVRTGIGSMITFATEPGNVALDGKGKNSPFTKALLKHIETPGLDIAPLLRSVRRDVIKATRRSQVPWNHSSLTDSFYFKTGKLVTKTRPEPVRSSDAAREWASLQSSKDTEDLKAYIAQFAKRFPYYGRKAKKQLNELKKKKVAVVVPNEIQKQEKSNDSWMNFGGEYGNTEDWNQPYDRNYARRYESEPARGYPTVQQENIAPLKVAIKRYADIVSKGGWGTLPKKIKLRVGNSGKLVETLRARLQITGDLRVTAGFIKTFDYYVETAVKRFQKRHGLTPTGYVDKTTVMALNVPASSRLRQLRINLTRVQSLLSNSAKKYVLVNIPAAHVEVIERGKVVSRHSAIVGKLDRQTPILTSKISGIAFNPNQTNRRESFPVGFVKIDFQNKHAVSLHDTPGQSLFGRNFRADSSGDVSVQNIQPLIAWLLKEEGWTNKRVAEIKRTKKTKEVRLKNKVPIILTYITSWVAPDGIVRFCRDLYGRDNVDVTASAY